MLVGIFLYRTYHIESGEQKSLLVKDSDVITVAQVNQVMPLPASATDPPEVYRCRADVVTETPIKGSPPKLFILYGDGRTCKDGPNFGSGRALLFLKKDKRDNLVVFRPELSVVQIVNDRLPWSKSDSLRDSDDMSVSAVVEDIKQVDAKSRH